MWYGDTIWPTLIALGSVAAVSGLLWWDRRRPALLVIAFLCLPAALGAIAVERQIVTPREEVTQRIEHLLRDFERRDEAATLDAISARAPELQQLAARAISRVEIQNVRLTDVNIEVSGEDVLRARAHFRVTADVTFGEVQRLPRQPTRWKSTWEQEADGQWRLLDIDQLDPLTGEPSQEARQYVN